MVCTLLPFFNGQFRDVALSAVVSLSVSASASLWCAGLWLVLLALLSVSVLSLVGAECFVWCRIVQCISELQCAKSEMLCV